MKKTLIFLFTVVLSHLLFSQQNICFSPAAISPLTGNGLSYSLGKADFNNDGQLDFVCYWYGGPAFNIRMSNGSGGYLPPVSYFYPFANISSIAAGDVNNDGNADLVLAIADSSYLKILTGNGTGTLNAPSLQQVGSRPMGMLIRDLNADGKNDLAVCNESSNSVSILIANNTGGFALPVNVPTGIKPSAIVSGDFNNDGKIDLVTSGSFTTAVLKGNGNGTFAMITSLNKKYGGLYQQKINVIAAPDMNGDGKADLAGIWGDSVYVTLSNSNFTFGTTTKYYMGQGTSSIDFGDFNNDGKMDLVTSNYTGRNYSILVGNGQGGSSGVTTNSINASFAFFQPQFVCATDYDGDGKTDLIITHDNCQDITILLNCNSVNVGQPEISLVKKPEVYPNPAENYINVQIPDDGSKNHTISILNSLGQELKSENIHEIGIMSLALNDLPNGLFLLSIQSEHTEPIILHLIISR